MIKNQFKVSTQDGSSDDWTQIPGLTKEDCAELNFICSNTNSKFGRGLNGIRRYLKYIGKTSGHIYKVELIQYSRKENFECYSITIK